MIDFILTHENEDVNTLLLKHKSIYGYPASFVATQIKGRKRVKEKLPTWYSNPALLYPPQQNLEQTSSEVTAQFKSEIMWEEKPGKTIVDLTGGFGVDAFYFSKKFETVWYVEPDKQLKEIATANHDKMAVHNIRHKECTALEFLNTTQSSDWIYLDPSRKDNGKKVFQLSDCEPKVVPLLPLLFKHSDTILIKASPLLDLKQGITQLPQTQKIFVVSVGNECKEILFLLKKDFSGEPEIICVNLPSKQRFSFFFTEEDQAQVNFENPQQYIYEPHSSILKAGAFKTIAAKSGVSKIGKNTHLYTHAAKLENFEGRIFKNLGELEDRKVQLPEGKANIISRNYPLTPDQIKKKYKLKDGGEKYLLAFSGIRKKYLIVAERLT